MTAKPSRRAYIDWARGVAVLLMIEAHTLDAWTRAADRRSVAFRNGTILGGFAAPSFLWLAGVAVVLSATSIARRQNSRAAAAAAICRRGAEIFILAFLFRVQAFTVSPGSHAISLFRVDILNIMGPAIAAAGIVWGVCRTTVGMVASYAATACVLAMATPLVRVSPLVDALPIWVQWHLRPAGDQTTFTMFPWAGFVFAGAAAGALLADAGNARDERRAHVALGVCGAALVAIGLYTASLPALYRQVSFWTSSPTYFALRAGIVTLALSACFALEQLVAPLGVVLAPLQRLGRSSLFVYWIHVELVYGYASWLWRGRLPIWATFVGCVLFSALMYAAVLLRDRLVARWRARRATNRLTRQATA